MAVMRYWPIPDGGRGRRRRGLCWGALQRKPQGPPKKRRRRHRAPPCSGEAKAEPVRIVEEPAVDSRRTTRCRRRGGRERAEAQRERAEAQREAREEADREIRRRARADEGQAQEVADVASDSAWRCRGQQHQKGAAKGASCGLRRALRAGSLRWRRWRPGMSCRALIFDTLSCADIDANDACRRRTASLPRCRSRPRAPAGSPTLHRARPHRRSTSARSGHASRPRRAARGSRSRHDREALRSRHQRRCERSHRCGPPAAARNQHRAAGPALAKLGGLLRSHQGQRAQQQFDGGMGLAVVRLITRIRDARVLLDRAACGTPTKSRDRRAEPCSGSDSARKKKCGLIDVGPRVFLRFRLCRWGGSAAAVWGTGGRERSRHRITAELQRKTPPITIGPGDLAHRLGAIREGDGRDQRTSRPSAVVSFIERYAGRWRLRSGST